MTGVMDLLSNRYGSICPAWGSWDNMNSSVAASMNVGFV